MKEKPYLVIGIIDAYGAIHHRPIWTGMTDMRHDYYWPNQTHKRWEFKLSEWQISKSILSKENLTSDEAEAIEALIAKHYEKPLWLQEGDEWEALGRPRSGKAYDKHRDKWDKIMKRKIS